MGRFAAWILWWMLLSVSGCGNQNACTPGAQSGCDCPGGIRSVQVCVEDGSRLGACLCGGDAGSQGDVAASADGNVGADAPPGVDAGGGCGTCSGGTPVCGPNGVCIGDPAVVGCSDGSREGFISTESYPSIAACAGRWGGGQNLRGMSTGGACGEPSGGACRGPADLCAAGWHVCMQNGWPGDLTDRIDEADCHAAVAGVGVFLAAADSTTVSGMCAVTLPLTCVGNSPVFEGSSVACGSESQYSEVLGHRCNSAVWRGNTWVSIRNPCNDAKNVPPPSGVGVNSAGATGVLCCRNPAVVGH